jgi:hypothetical protein
MILDFDDQLTADSATTPTTSVQDFSGTSGTAIVGNKVKDGGAARNWGAGEELIPYVRVTVAGAGASGGFQIDIVTDSNSNCTTSPVVLSTKTIATSALTANSVHALPPLSPIAGKRYLGLKVTPLSSNSTAGSFIVGFRARNASPQNGVNYI